MQRDEDGGVVISCDYCGRDWHPYQPDPDNPMIEGHRGSVIFFQWWYDLSRQSSIH